LGRWTRRWPDRLADRLESYLDVDRECSQIECRRGNRFANNTVAAGDVQKTLDGLLKFYRFGLSKDMIDRTRRTVRVIVEDINGLLKDGTVVLVLDVHLPWQASIVVGVVVTVEVSGVLIWQPWQAGIVVNVVVPVMEVSDVLICPGMFLNEKGSTVEVAADSRCGDLTGSGP
jgi:hypothetical protein